LTFTPFGAIITRLSTIKKGKKMFKKGDLVSYKWRGGCHGRGWNKHAHFYNYAGIVEYADDSQVIISYASFAKDGSEYTERTTKFTQRKTGNWIEQGASEDPKGRNILTHYDTAGLYDAVEISETLIFAAKKLNLDLVKIVEANLQGEIARCQAYIQKVQADSEYEDSFKQQVKDWTTRDIQRYQEKLQGLTNPGFLKRLEIV
jgi:hypothetical protein